MSLIMEMALSVDSGLVGFIPKAHSQGRHRQSWKGQSHLDQGAKCHSIKNTENKEI